MLGTTSTTSDQRKAFKEILRNVSDFNLLRSKKLECLDQAQLDRLQQPDSPRCPTVWDVVLCWKSTLAGENFTVSCPKYIVDFDPQASVTRQCGWDGAWLEPNASFSGSYTNYSTCIADNGTPPLSVQQIWVPIIKRVSQIGYSVSLCTLVLAFIVLCSIKKLRCPRNNLHLHLFASFILRAAMALLKDALFVRGVGLPRDLEIDAGGNIVLFIPGRSNWECKLIISLWQYSIMANYSWILMEGLYLHNLIFLAVFSDNSAITLYVALGWGLPASVVLPWVVGRRLYDNNLCWTLNSNLTVYYFIRIPTIATVLLSFALFVNIARVLLMKMQASIQIQRRGMRYRRWAKSTMVLVPLFGTHYALLLGLSASMGKNEVLEIVWLLLDQTFASFQGCLVALLYCLLTREVRQEIRRRWSSAQSLWDHRLSQRPGSLLQSAPSLSKQHGRRASLRSNDLACQISGHLQFEKLPDDVIESKDKEVQSMTSLGLGVGLRAKGCIQADAQSWV